MALKSRSICKSNANRIYNMIVLLQLLCTPMNEYVLDFFGTLGWENYSLNSMTRPTKDITKAWLYLASPVPAQWQNCAHIRKSTTQPFLTDFKYFQPWSLQDAQLKRKNKPDHTNQRKWQETTTFLNTSSKIVTLTFAKKLRRTYWVSVGLTLYFNSSRKRAARGGGCHSGWLLANCNKESSVLPSFALSWTFLIAHLASLSEINFTAWKIKC